MSFARDLFASLETRGDREAIVTGRETITYRQLRREIDVVAANFRRVGVAAGDNVGLAMQDSVEALLGLLACWRLSATAVMIDFRAPRSQRAALARDFNLALIFESAAVPGDGDYAHAVFDGAWRLSAPAGELPPPGDDSQPAFYLFTSGTTGTPRAYVQSHAGVAARIAERRYFLDTEEMRLLTPMTFTYSATRHHVLAYLAFGGTVNLFPPFFSPSELAEALLAFRTSSTALPPPVITRLVREAGPRSEPLFPGLKSLLSDGGPALPDDKVAAYRTLSHGYKMGYASGLTGTMAQLDGPDILRRPETTGRAAPGVRLDILNEAGDIAAPGEPGLIRAWTSALVSSVILPGGHVMVDPETMGPGWGIPGDLGFIDEEGFLTIVDRKADVIVRGGVNVAPQELEKVIALHPRVVEVAVVGFPDDIMGQEIAAFIVTDGGTVGEFAAHFRASIAPDRRPREIRLVPALPYNANGKLLRRQLVEQLSREVAQRKRGGDAPPAPKPAG